jgi:hypothetical protein
VLLVSSAADGHNAVGGARRWRPVLPAQLPSPASSCTSHLDLP